MRCGDVMRCGWRLHSRSHRLFQGNPHLVLTREGLHTDRMGEALRDDERETFTTLTGRQRKPGQRVEELCAVVGRRGGKS